MKIETRYAFLSENNLELIRHISFPFLVYCQATNATNVDFECIINSFLIIPARHYVFKNMSISVNQCDLQVSGIDAPYMPLINFQGLQASEDLRSILAQWGSPTYTYNGVLNNPNTAINKADLIAKEVTLAANYNYLSFSNIARPGSYSNIIAQKPSCSVVSTIGSAGGGFAQGVISKMSPNDFYFRNSNYSSVAIYFTPMMANLTTELSALAGIIDFDLYQYSMKN